MNLKITPLLLISSILVLIAAAFAIQIYLNEQDSKNCMDCRLFRTIMGSQYKDWEPNTWNCPAFEFTQEKATDCLKAHYTNQALDTTTRLTEINIPMVTIFNTVLLTSTVPAYAWENQESCTPSFAIDQRGKTYSKGGCLA
ncbi:MAG: hypothetical protein Q7R47_04145 [Candidatus Diapherotrites archaeon]|nr:hypothetical protein [Candidatus Diapherotrites archaeon]